MGRVSGPVPVFTKSFESAEQIITAAGLLTLAHGLGVKPGLVVLSLKNVIVQHNYSVGDEAPVNVGAQGAGLNRGTVVIPDATNIVLRFASDGNTFEILNKTTGVTVAILNSNWKLIVRGWA